VGNARQKTPAFENGTIYAKPNSRLDLMVACAQHGSAPKGWLRPGSQLILLSIVAAAAIYARNTLLPLQEVMKLDLALTDNDLALLQGPALAVPLLITTVPLGYLVDRYSRVRLLFLLTVLCLVGSTLTALLSNFVGLFLARGLIGLAAPAIATAAFSLSGDIYRSAQRGRANMIITISQVAGASGALGVGGALLEMFGSLPHAWRWAALVTGIPLVLAALAVAALREPARTDVSVEEPSARQALAGLVRYRALVIPLLSGFIMIAAVADGALSWVVPVLSRSFSMASGRSGMIMAVVVLVSGIAGPILGGCVADICQRNAGTGRTLSAMTVLAFLSVVASAFPLAPGIASATFLLTIFLTTGIAIGVMVTTVFTVAIPNELRGLCISALWGTGAIFGLGLAPGMVSLLSTTIGGPAMLGRSLAIVCFTSSLLGAVAFFAGRRLFSPLMS
jgi:MFS family permease